MQTQLVIFLACAFVTLMGNAIAMWLIYRRAQRTAETVIGNLRAIQESSTTRAWITSLHKASDRALTATNTVKRQMQSVDEAMAHAQDVYGYGLALADVRFERACNQLSGGAEKVQTAVTGPAHRFAAAASGVTNALSVVSAISSEEAIVEATRNRSR